MDSNPGATQTSNRGHGAPAVSFAFNDQDERIIEIYSTALNRQCGFIIATDKGLRFSIDLDPEPSDLGGGFSLHYEGAPQSLQFNLADWIERTRQYSLNQVKP